MMTSQNRWIKIVVFPQPTTNNKLLREKEERYIFYANDIEATRQIQQSGKVFIIIKTIV